MKRSIKTTEFQLTVLLYVLVLCASVPVMYKGILVPLLVASYVLARGIFKRYRGMCEQGLLTTEFYLTVLSHITLAILTYFHLSPVIFVAGLGLVQVSYNLGRGFTKMATQPHRPQIRL